MSRRWHRGVALLIFILVATLVLACAQAPTPTSKPKEPYNITIGSAYLGTTTYVVVNATTELINKNSTWLKATFLETTGYVENVRTLVEEPAKRKTFAFAGDLFTLYQAKVGDPPFKTPYTTSKIIARMMDNPTVIGTLNPSIKSPKDLVGKKVANGTKGSAVYQMTYLIFGKEGYGIWDQVKWEPLGLADGKNALIDGVINATGIGGSTVAAGATVDKPKTVAANAAGQELVDRSKPYIVNLDKETLDKVKKATGYPVLWVESPAGTWGPNQPQPVGGWTYLLTWSADIEMPADVVYELTRIIYENADKFAAYHVVGKAITREGLAMVPGTTEADFHPGAVKFYKERGIKVGG